MSLIDSNGATAFEAQLKEWFGMGRIWAEAVFCPMRKHMKASTPIKDIFLNMP
jgi:hypothetical protein